MCHQHSSRNHVKRSIKLTMQVRFLHYRSRLAATLICLYIPEETKIFVSTITKLCMAADGMLMKKTATRVFGAKRDTETVRFLIGKLDQRC